MSQTVFVVSIETEDGNSSIYCVKSTEEKAKQVVKELSSRLNDVTPTYDPFEVEE